MKRRFEQQLKFQRRQEPDDYLQGLLNRVPARQIAVGQNNPPTPFADGSFSTVVKCQWCKKRSKFYFDKAGGGTEHKFQRWAQSQVPNKQQMICDNCDEKGKPPHGKFLSSICSEKDKPLRIINETLWEIIVTYVFPECYLAEIRLIAQHELTMDRRVHMNDWTPTFDQHPASYILDPRMYVGLDCPYCRNGPPTRGRLCRHIKNLRKRHYQSYMLIKAVKDIHIYGPIYLPGQARALGLTRREVEETIQDYERSVYPPRQPNVILDWRENDSSDDSEDSEELAIPRNRGRHLRNRHIRYKPPGAESRLPMCWNCNEVICMGNLPARCARCRINTMCESCGINTHDAQTWAGEPELYPACQSCRRKHRRGAAQTRETWERSVRQRSEGSPSTTQP